MLQIAYDLSDTTSIQQITIHFSQGDIIGQMYRFHLRRHHLVKHACEYPMKVTGILDSIVQG